MKRERRTDPAPPPIPDEHPDDRKERIESEAYGRRYAGEFVMAHLALVTRLIGLYADGEAESLHTTLREIFWGKLWEPKDRIGHE